MLVSEGIRYKSCAASNLPGWGGISSHTRPESKGTLPATDDDDEDMGILGSIHSARLAAEIDRWAGVCCQP